MQMTKIVSSILCICLLVFLCCGCDSNNQNQSDSLTPAASTEPQSAAELPTNEPEENEAIGSRLFGHDRSDLVNHFSDYFGNTEYPNAFSSEPKELDGGLGRTVYVYTIDSCSELYFYVKSDSDELCKVVLMSNSNTMDDYAVHTFVCYAASLLGFFAGEAGEGESDQAMAELAIFSTPFSNDTINFYTGPYSSFSYSSVNGLLTLTIEPIES